MRFFMAILLVGILAAAVAAPAADNSLGTWKLNLGKSRFTPAPFPYKTLTMVREASDGGVKTTVTAERIDRTRMNITYTVKYDGAAVVVQGTGYPSDTISMMQLDANTFTSERRKPGGKYHTTGRFVISNGGKTMTNTLTGTDADGKPMAATIIYDRQ